MAPSAPRVLAVYVGVIVMALGLAEWLVRWATHNTLPTLDCYEQVGVGYGSVRLLPHCERWQHAPDGRRWHTALDAQGVRITDPAPTGPTWLIVGDSQAFGLHLDTQDSLASRLTALGMPSRTLAAPAWGVEDALAGAATWVRQQPDTLGVMLVVNGANDWAEVGQPVDERYAVIGGWLINQHSATGWAAAVLRTPLGRSHLVLRTLALAGAPASDPWALSPFSHPGGTARIAQAIATFDRDLPGLLRVLIVPVDFGLTPERALLRLSSGDVARRPWEHQQVWGELATALAPVPTFNSATVLTEPSHFLPNDLHLSATGVAALAEGLDGE